MPAPAKVIAQITEKLEFVISFNSRYHPLPQYCNKKMKENKKDVSTNGLIKDDTNQNFVDQELFLNKKYLRKCDFKFLK